MSDSVFSSDFFQELRLVFTDSAPEVGNSWQTEAYQVQQVPPPDRKKMPQRLPRLFLGDLALGGNFLGKRGIRHGADTFATAMCDWHGKHGCCA